LAYAELGAVIPRSGGEFIYFYESMKDLHPFLGPLPGFLCIWIGCVCVKPAAVAVLSLTFSRYLLRPIWTDVVGNVDTGHPTYEDHEVWSERLVAAACACETHTRLITERPSDSPPPSAKTIVVECKDGKTTLPS
jgi:hypothetical protein